MNARTSLCIIGSILTGSAFSLDTIADDREISLYSKVDIPAVFRQTNEKGVFGGDIRIGDLSGNGVCDFIVYRSAQGGDIRQHDGGIKPCYIAAFDIEGKALWEQGEGGDQPVRPGPVCVYDFDGDGIAEIANLWHRPELKADASTNWLTLSDMVLQIRSGKTGRVLRERHIPEIASIRIDNPKSYTWPHQRILIANFRGLERPRDLLLKAGDTLVAVTDQLNVLWTYRIRLDDESRFPPKFPAVGDLDGNGRDEVHGGYFLLSPEGRPHWKLERSTYMDSVAMHPWDSGKMRAIGSGTPQVMGIDPEPILGLEESFIPHGQELRVADYIASSPGPEMAIRSHGHETRVKVVSLKGEILQDFDLNEAPNNTGMESVYFEGPDSPALLFNGGLMWDLNDRSSFPLPGLPPANGKSVHRMGFYHAIPVDISGDGNEDLVVYDPTATSVYVYSIQESSAVPASSKRFGAGPRQYNPRLMD